MSSIINPYSGNSGFHLLSTSEKLTSRSWSLLISIVYLFNSFYAVNAQETPPPDFVEYDREPIVTSKTKPGYPEIALRAGLEGNVYVKV